MSGEGDDKGQKSWAEWHKNPPQDHPDGFNVFQVLAEIDGEWVELKRDKSWWYCDGGIRIHDDVPAGTKIRVRYLTGY